MQRHPSSTELIPSYARGFVSMKEKERKIHVLDPYAVPPPPPQAPPPPLFLISFPAHRKFARKPSKHAFCVIREYSSAT
jgi:alkanesulfonate monooxygenase SsuD/methylene tetrahydromethanopterin reductase-like flavin-dependent oxidoreductase (luciferase family)